MTDSAVNPDNNTETPSPNAASTLSNTMDIFVAPSNVFRSLRVKPTILMPLLILLIPYSLAFVWYYAIVDFSWMVDYLIATDHSNLPEKDQLMLEKHYRSTPAYAWTTFTIVITILFVLFINVVHAAFLLLVSALGGKDFYFEDWFSMVCWCNLPNLLVVLSMCMSILLSNNGQIGFDQINALSFNSLFVHADAASGIKSIFDFLSLSTVWYLVLLTLGYKQWTESSVAKSLSIVVLPIVALLSCWVLLSLN